MAQEQNLDTKKYSDQLSDKVVVEADIQKQPNKPVVTPEPPVSAEAGKYPQMASFLDRLVAVVIDGFVLGLLAAMVNGGISLLSNMLASTDMALFDMLGGIMALMGSLIGVVFAFLYYGYFFTKDGWTPGGMVMKIKVVNESDLKYITWTQSIKRVLMTIISQLFFYLGYFWYFMSLKRQTWHDSFAKCYVVKTDQGGKLLMGGPESYKKEPVKVVIPCGCWALVMIASIILMGIASKAIMDVIGNSKGYYNDPSSMQFNYESDSNFDLNSEYNYNNDEVTPEEFNQMFEELQKGLEDIPGIEENDPVIPQAEPEDTEI